MTGRDLHLGHWMENIFISILLEVPLNPIFSPQLYGEIYLMRLSDKKIIPLTDNKWEDSLPSWRTHQ